MELKDKQAGFGMAFIFAIFIFIIGMTVLNLIIPEVTTFRADMSCSDAANISDGTKLVCLAGGFVVPYFVILVFSIAGGFILEKFAL